MQFTNGTVHVKASYDKSYELILMPLQAAVLLPFNDSERGLACLGGGGSGGPGSLGLLDSRRLQHSACGTFCPPCPPNGNATASTSHKPCPARAHGAP
jgi:hypothetical protein